MDTLHTDQSCILTVNAGSSSIKMAVFSTSGTQKLFEGAVNNIGQQTAQLVMGSDDEKVVVHDHLEAVDLLTNMLSRHITASNIMAVGHRIVHGGPKYYKTIHANNQVIQELREVGVFDPEHLPIELDIVALFQKELPNTPQVLCFDTAFHHGLPTQSRLLPLPRHFEALGIRRYGFHGLSYAYILEELRRVEGTTAAHGKVIIAHLGSGASLAALRDGKSIDTTMSMTPASGIPMSTRSGDLDPGLLFYLNRTQGYDTERLHHITNFESGLLGISGITPDMKQLIEQEADHSQARDAVDIFCYHVTKTIGAFAAALGGLNTLVFTGGMGENAPKVRTRICKDLEFIGVHINEERNQESARLISADDSPVGVHVIHTDESVTIARETIKTLGMER